MGPWWEFPLPRRPVKGRLSPLCNDASVARALHGAHLAALRSKTRTLHRAAHCLPPTFHPPPPCRHLRAALASLLI